jgi:hypothetical protein
MSHHLSGCTFMLGCTLTVGLALGETAGAQYGTPQARSATVTVEGCLTRESDLRGQTFDDNDLDDFVLTNVRMVKGSAPVSTTAGKPAGTPAGTSGAAATMYEVEGLSAATLMGHAGHRVQIDGTFEDLDDDVADIRGTVIRQVSGECPAAK